MHDPFPFIYDRPACTCGTPRPDSFNAHHAKDCPRYELLSPGGRIIRWLWQGDWCLVDGNTRRFHQHVAWWMGMLVIVMVGNWYIVSQLSIVRDLLSAICWLGMNALLGGMAANVAFQPIRIRNAYESGKDELRAEARKYGIYFDHE